MTVYILTQERHPSLDPMPIKIGYSKNVHRRMSQLQSGSPYQLSLMGKIKTQGRSADQILERALHERYARRRLDFGEWFHLEPSDVIDMLKLHFADSYIAVGTEPFEIVSYDRDAVPEYASLWLWRDVEAYEFCPVYGWAGGWSYNENHGGERCLKCGASESAYDRAY